MCEIARLRGAESHELTHSLQTRHFIDLSYITILIKVVEFVIVFNLTSR